VFLRLAWLLLVNTGFISQYIIPVSLRIFRVFPSLPFPLPINLTHDITEILLKAENFSAITMKNKLLLSGGDFDASFVIRPIFWSEYINDYMPLQLFWHFWSIKETLSHRGSQTLKLEVIGNIWWPPCNLQKTLNRLKTIYMYNPWIVIGHIQFVTIFVETDRYRSFDFITLVQYYTIHCTIWV
jgi:hypothetical protein